MITLLKMPALFLGMLAVFCCLGSFFIRENRYESGHLGETVLFGFIAYYFLFELISVPMMALDAAALLKEEGISAGLLDMYCVKPLDKEGLVEAAKKAKVVISIEEHAPFGGLGSMVSQVVGAECPRKVVHMSLPDAPVITGTSKEVFDYYGLNAEGIAKKAKELLA